MAVVAVRYARALAAAAGQESAEIYRQLEDFRDLLVSAADLRQVLLNPTIPVKKRVEILHAIAVRSGMSATARNFVSVLLEHERLNELGEILGQFQLEIDRKQGISEAEIVTARPMDEEARADLERHVAGLAGTRVRATFRHDGSLLGGMVVRIGSTVYDGSIRGRLDRLKDRLTAD